MTIEIIPHRTKQWPNGAVTYLESAHSLAEKCGRQEVTIQGAIEAQCSTMVYAFLEWTAEYGLDPWRYLEGIDPSVCGDTANIWFDDGDCVSVDQNDCPIRFFVSKAYIEKENAK